MIYMISHHNMFYNITYHISYITHINTSYVAQHNINYISVSMYETLTILDILQLDF